MLETSENCTNSNVEGYHVKVDETEDDECTSLWSIDDDTMFYAQGLKHHSAGKGRSLYVTWNENYLLNFLFKTSNKSGNTTLTKVRIVMPVHNQQQEIIANILILEMNTLLHMKSGSVYYFSSVKSMHRVDWLSGVRCMALCPHKQFSVMRLLGPLDHDLQNQKRTLSLEVYNDVPQLGDRFGNDILRHSYDITFDLDNLFNCDWLDERFTLTSLTTDQENISFLQQLVDIGDVLRTHQEIRKLNINQEVHIYTISGNVFILVGGTVSEDELILNPQVDNFSIHLLNTYFCPIETIWVDCKHSLLIVLMQTGHIDIWYKSNRMFGSILHCQHEISPFLCYDFASFHNTIFFTSPEDVLQLQIITNNNIGVEKECFVKETRKSLNGMTACTFVGGLQQLICLSINNIFYRINFATQNKITENCEIKSETNVENLSYLYVLNAKRVNDLRAKSHIVEELMQQPKYLHNSIEKEFQKQQILALESKSEIFKKIFHCHLEYHLQLPGIEYFHNDLVHIKTNFQSQKINAQSIFCLIFMSIKSNKASFLSSILTTTTWYLHISYFEKYFQLYIPYQILNNELCIIVDVPLEDLEKQNLPIIFLDLITFVNHNNHSLCLKYNLNLQIDESTYINLFSANTQNLQIFRNSFEDIKTLLREQLSHTLISKNPVKLKQIYLKLKQCHKIPKNIFHNVMKKMKAKLTWTTGIDFKIYYLHQYLIELNYSDNDEILTLCSNHSEAIFYIKLLLMYAAQSLNDVEEVGQILDHTMHQMLANCGSMVICDPDSNLFSMRMENLRNIYFKLRLEFYDKL